MFIFLIETNVVKIVTIKHWDKFHCLLYIMTFVWAFSLICKKSLIVKFFKLEHLLKFIISRRQAPDFAI
jgi:hypothetical protein